MNKEDLRGRIVMAVFRSLIRGNFDPKIGTDLNAYFSGISRHELTSSILSSNCKRRDTRRTMQFISDEKGKTFDLPEEDEPETFVFDLMEEIRPHLTDYESVILDCWAAELLREPIENAKLYEKIAKLLKVDIKSVDNAFTRIREKVAKYMKDF